MTVAQIVQLVAALTALLTAVGAILHSLQTRRQVSKSAGQPPPSSPSSNNRP